MSRKSTPRPRAYIETLEKRSLFSTLNMADFGAIVNDGKDDSAAIRAALSKSQDGDTIYFRRGTYDIAVPITLKGNRNYAGDHKRSILKGATPARHIFRIQENNVRIEQLAFDGKPIFIASPHGSMVENIIINNNLIHVHARGSDYNGITFNTGLRNSRITNNTFDRIVGDNGIYGYYWDNLTIANNSFLNGNEGIHVIDHRDSSRNLLIEQNYFSGIRRMGIEYQGGGYNTIVQDNFYEKPLMSNRFSQNNATFAFSIIADRSVGTIVRRNTSIAPERPDGTGVRIIFEVGGDKAIVEQNYSYGGNHVLAANDGTGTTSVLARNNRFEGYRQSASGRGLTLQNTGPDVELNWNINRGRPKPNKRLGLAGYII